MRRRADIAAVLLAAGLAGAAVAAEDAAWRRDFDAKYAPLKVVAPDLVVFEMRHRVGTISSRGSAAGNAATAPRVRGYEAVLLPALRQIGCNSEARTAPAAGLAEAVQAAAVAQKLPLEGGDLAELGAFAQRLLDSVEPRRWCTLRSFDEVG
jgi:hypothetical protein